LQLGGKEYTLVLDLDETLIHFDCDEEDDENNGREADSDEE
jgi:predicted HAD superfamily phosphohydrolase YqeG